MPASTAPAAKQAILTLLAARPALASVDRTWGSPTETDDITAEMIFLGDVELTGEFRALGGQRRDEDYTITISVAVHQYGDDEQSTEERAWDLLDEISGALATDPYLGGLLYEAAAIRSARQTNTPAPNQWGALITAQIGCAARFTP
jgi:hypothetical protein